MHLNTLLGDALSLTPTSIEYLTSQRLAALFPTRARLETEDHLPLEPFAQHGHCELGALAETPHPLVWSSWNAEDEVISRTVACGLRRLRWQGHDLEVLALSWPGGCGQERRSWVLGESEPVVRGFFEAIGRWAADLHDEVLVFQDGYWSKSDELFEAIKGASFENLVLRPGLADEIKRDAVRFFGAEALYAEHGLPWKRGVLLAGPPGNGKTHIIKALVNALGAPCLYVKSFQAEHSTESENVRRVFTRAREQKRCLLVLEDLDSLINDGNRAFFLNELDGFARNDGLFTLATTNHPEQLDPAIVERPSRFDRTYRFELPAQSERVAYLTRWAEGLRPALRPTERALFAAAERTEGFSFAYLKELTVSSMMAWLDAAETPDAMDGVLERCLRLLREQVRAPREG